MLFSLFNLTINPKNLDTQKIAVIILKLEQYHFTTELNGPKDADGIANRVDPGQTAPLGAVWSWSTLCAQTCLSENLGALW